MDLRDNYPLPFTQFNILDIIGASTLVISDIHMRSHCIDDYPANMVLGGE